MKTYLNEEPVILDPWVTKSQLLFIFCHVVLYTNTCILIQK